MEEHQRHRSSVPNPESSPFLRALPPKLGQEILVVEDGEDDARLIEEALSEIALSSFRYRFLRDGESAIAHLRNARQQTVLAILDLHLPGRDGFEVLREIKSDPQLRHVPVVMLTSSGREEDVVRAYAEGASTYVIKPDDYAELREVVELLVLYWINVARIPSSEG